MSLVKSLKKCARRVLPKKVRKALKKQTHKNEVNTVSKTEKKTKIPSLQNRMAELVALEANWDKKTAKEEMRKTKDAYGYTFKQYYENDLYLVPFEEQKEYFEKIVAEKEAQKAQQKAENREHYLNKVIEKTGWEKEYAKSVIRKAAKRTGCTSEEFFLYKFYELSEAEQDDVFLTKESKKITKKYNVDRKFVNILYDKELSNIYFDKYLGRAWCVNNKNKISEDEFVNKFSGIKKVFYKPLKGHHGDGARPFDLTPENIRDVYRELMELPIGVVEEYIVQHRELNRLAPSAVNTMRVVTISSNDKPVLEENGNNIEIVYASLKMGGKNSVVDNLVGGGMVAGVDLETGKLVTNAGDDQGNEYAEHPATGVTIKGFQIPFFNEAIQLVKDVYADKKMEGYLGWDIAITENGPVIIEINTVPGVILFQLPYMLEKQGKKPYMKKYYYTAEDYEQDRKKMNLQRRESCVQKTIEATGWTEEQALAHIKNAKKQTGVSYKNYISAKLYEASGEELQEQYEAFLHRKNVRKNKREHYINQVVRASGWERSLVVDKMKKAWDEVGASAEMFAVYKFWDVPEDEWKTYFTKGDVNALRKKYNKDPEIINLFMNKDLFCEKFDKYMGRPWCVSEKLTYEVFCEKFGKIGKVIYKPTTRSGGKGVEVFDFDESNCKEVYEQIKELPDGLIEGFFRQHPDMQKFSLKSVNTLRVGTIVSYDDIPGTENGKVNIVYAGLRMGSGEKYVDNLHSGGIMTDIDVDTGIIVTDGVDFDNNVYTKHPDTGTTIKGFQIPYFEELKEMLKEAGDGIEGYYGWDVAIGENGPVIIEVNTNAGPTALQAPYVPQKIGMRHRIEKYL